MTPKKRPAAKAARAKRPEKAAKPKVATKPGSRAKAVKRSPPAGERTGGGLVVVESPTKARTIGKYLGPGYSVKATVGHVRDLPKRVLGVDVDKGFAPTYVTIKGKAKALAELKRASKTAAAVYLATDPDREGEAIAWHVAEQINGGRKVRRVLFHEITKDAVHEAMANPVALDERKVEAQQARRILDRLVGYKASPLLWRSVRTGLSAGRVQTVALRLIVEREAEIRAFRPQEYWTIEAQCEGRDKRFTARLHKVDGKKPELHSRGDAEAVVAAVKGKPFVVSDVTRKERRKRPSAPFTTSTLQQEAAKQLGFATYRTMRAAQDLYEGVEVGDEGAVGLITYMRTDSTRVAPVAIDHVRSFIRSTFDARYLPTTPNLYLNKAARTQDAHEAIRPTDVSRRPEALKGLLSADQLKLYQLIWRRFVASQMAPAVYDTTTIDLTVGRYLFHATGSVVLFDGYHAVYHEGREAEEGLSLDDLAPVPALEVGERVRVHAVTPSQHFTEPPPRFSEASLVKELERLGIGRPSTYASIVSTLRTRDYVTMKDRRFHPTEMGETVCKVMVSRFPDIFNVVFTSEMEDELDKVEEGELGWQRVLENFYGPFAKALESVDTASLIREAHDVGEVEQTPCPECGSKLTVKGGRFGPFIACTRYPECRYTKPLKRHKTPDRPTDEKCAECGSPMVIKTGRYGEFLACTSYPKCKHTRPVPLGVKCPQCGTGELAERRTRKGRSFFGCSRYPECTFSTWHRPVPEPCPQCGYVGVEQRSTKTRGDYRRCVKCGHEFAVRGAQEGAAVVR
ncbi:MAG: type I DNA topoisomerase [Gemmatimonadetes bacterium]|nr:type I DNA topoisomerase [Gemmatimonadota bacterium]